MSKCAAVLLQVLAHDARDVLREALRSRARLPLCIGLLSFSKLHTRTPSLSSVYNGSLSVTTCDHHLRALERHLAPPKPARWLCNTQHVERHSHAALLILAQHPRAVFSGGKGFRFMPNTIKSLHAFPVHELRMSWSTSCDALGSSRSYTPAGVMFVLGARHRPPSDTIT